MNLRKVSDHLTMCKACHIVRSVRQPLLSQVSIENVKLAIRTVERLYTDVVGAIKSAYLNGLEYFITLLDEYTGYSMVNFLSLKSRAGDAVKSMILEFGNLLET